MSIKRYDIVGSYDDYLSETDDGEYVKHDDHLAALAAKDAEIKNTGDQWAKDIKAKDRVIERLDAEIVKWTSLVGRREQIHEAELAAKDAEIERLKSRLEVKNPDDHIIDERLVKLSLFACGHYDEDDFSRDDAIKAMDAFRAHEAEIERLREALEGVRLTDRTPPYEHHEPRPDGLLPRDGRDKGTCWLTPKEIATRAIALAGEVQDGE